MNSYPATLKVHWLNLFAKFSIAERTAGLDYTRYNNLARIGQKKIPTTTW